MFNGSHIAQFATKSVSHYRRLVGSHQYHLFGGGRHAVKSKTLPFQTRYNDELWLLLYFYAALAQNYSLHIIGTLSKRSAGFRLVQTSEIRNTILSFFYVSNPSILIWIGHMRCGSIAVTIFIRCRLQQQNLCTSQIRCFLLNGALLALATPHPVR